MPYRNKLYIAFDGDEDMAYYRILLMWKANEHIDFDFYNAHDLYPANDSSLSESIKAQLRQRMLNSKVMLLLVGARTKYLRNFVPYEIRLARRLDIPMIVANINGRRGYDANRCPSAVTETDTNTVHISFEAKIIKYALDDYPDYYHSHKLSVRNNQLDRTYVVLVG
ncbi:MAG TPA: TIR domain-containing protein [Streptosporangiaceae bacterium]